MSKKIALLTGINGQDGANLSRLLLDKGYEVHGVIRRASLPNTERIDDIFDPEDRTHLHYGDLTEGLHKLIYEIKPDMLFNTAAMSVHKDSLCPIMASNNIDYRTIESLFKEQLKKGKKIRKEIIDGIEVEVIDLPNCKQLRALSMWNNKGTWFPIRQLIRHKYKGKMIEMSQRFGNICVTPNHSIYDINYKLRKPQENPNLLNIRSLNYKRKVKDTIKLSFIGKYIKKGNYIYIEQTGNKGMVKQSLSGKNLEAFCRFVGAFVSEGWTTYSKPNDSYHICICNNDKKWLEELEKDIKRFYKGNICFVKDKKGCWRLELKSKVFYKICQYNFGLNSNTKKLPVWFTSLSDKNLNAMWKTLREGDGNNLKRGNSIELWRYGTTSYKLACQLGFLFSLLKIEYTQYIEYNDKNPKWNKCWKFNQCESYQPTVGDNKIREIDYDDYVYDIEVAETHNFAVGVGNIVVHNSHVRISFDIPIYTMETVAVGVARLLEDIKNGIKWGILKKDTKFLQCSSVSFNEPVMIKYNNAIIRTDFSAVYNMWHKDNIRNIDVLTSNDKGITVFKKIKNVLDHGKKEVYEINLYNGNTLTLTGDHSLITMKENKFIETRVIDLKDKDTLITFCNNKTRFKEQKHILKWTVELSKFKIGNFKTTKEKDFNIEKKEYKIKLNEDIAYLLGCFCAEGYANTKKHRYKFSLTFGDHEKGNEARLKCEKIINKYFNEKVSTVYRNSSNVLVISKKYLTLFFSNFVGTCAKDKRLLKELYTSNYNVKIAFLNGYSQDARIVPKTNEIRYSTVHKDLAIDVLWLLRTMGIGSKTCKRICKGRILPQGTYMKESTVYDIIIPACESWLSEGYKKGQIGCLMHCLDKNWLKEKFRKNPSKKTLEKKEHSLYNSDIGMQKIKSIKKLSKKERVGDFSVEDTEKWYCGIIPILVHNSSEMYGSTPPPQNENTIFNPVSPYGISKLCAFHLVKAYRNGYNMFASNSICFNHEGKYRSINFVTRKITYIAARIALGMRNKIELGNLDALRDWGNSSDYVKAMLMILEHDKPDDFVISTGEYYSVREFAERVFKYFNLDFYKYLVNNDILKRPNEVPALLGDSTKIRETLGWKPEFNLDMLIKEMCDHDYKLAQNELKLKDNT